METTYLQKPSNKYYLISFLLFLVTLLGVFFYLRPLWDEVNSLSMGRDDIMEQKTALQDKLVNLQQLQQNLNLSSEVSRETSLTAIPEKLEEDKLITDIVKVARDNDVSMNGINFGIPVSSAAGEIAKTTININLTGTESALTGFLRGIEANARKIVVNSITVQMAASEADVQLVNFNVNMETYYQGEI